MGHCKHGADSMSPLAISSKRVQLWVYALVLDSFTRKRCTKNKDIARRAKTMSILSLLESKIGRANNARSSLSILDSISFCPIAKPMFDG